MKQKKLLVIAMTLFGLSFTAWEGAVAAPFYCIFTGQANNVATTWSFTFPQILQYGSVSGGVMIGVNNTLNTVANGSFTLSGSQANMAWNEGPGPNFPFTRRITVQLGPNLTGTGQIVDVGTPGTFSASASITSANCLPAVALP